MYEGNFRTGHEPFSKQGYDRVSIFGFSWRTTADDRGYGEGYEKDNGDLEVYKLCGTAEIEARGQYTKQMIYKYTTSWYYLIYVLPVFTGTL